MKVVKEYLNEKSGYDYLAKIYSVKTKDQMLTSFDNQESL